MLWPVPKDVPRASQIQVDEVMVDPEDIKRITSNIDDTLENRKDGKDDPLDRPLSPPRSARKRSGSDQSSKGERPGKGYSGKGESGKGEHDMSETEKKKLAEASSQVRPPDGSGATSSNRAPSPIRQGTKRPAGTPASPESIERLANTYWKSHGTKMRKHEVTNYPKTFTYYNQRLHFVLDDFLKGLVFEPEVYSYLASTIRRTS